MRLSLIVFAMAFSPLAIQLKAQTPAPPVEKAADAVFSAVTQDHAPGLAVLVRKNGRTLLEKGYGVRDLRGGARIDPQTNFRLASFTKQFTAMAIMLLVHDGKLRYDQALTEVFPDFPAYGKKITVRNLLNHTGGLPDYEDLMDAQEKIKGPLWSPEHQIQDDEVLALLEKEAKGRFAPGTSWSYSNSGYVVLGLIVARASGQSYGGFLQARIFAPLHMDHTIVYQKGKNEVTNRAFGHSKEGDTLKETDQSSTSATLGDGGVYSNLEDLAKWDDRLRNHTLLSAEEMAPALVPAKLADGSPTYWPAAPNDDNLHPGKPVSYGFGWFLDPYQTQPRMWHTGSTMGFRTVIERFTGEGLTIIVLSNRTDLDPEALAVKTADLYLNLGPKE
ncbi:MAG TPA: serine hydrolase domain-containing protein [Verrucomicrobiae bacterium]|jgi:CubicO group peptidase (beta-lactamase class C family)|nr:serine hydrolase domain-containing protein [Verrucomicrobiae bacterium]